MSLRWQRAKIGECGQMKLKTTLKNDKLHMMYFVWMINAFYSASFFFIFSIYFDLTMSHRTTNSKLIQCLITKYFYYKYVVFKKMI